MGKGKHKLSIDNNIQLFRWSELFYWKLDIEVSLDALRKLNSNQETNLDKSIQKLKEIMISDEQYSFELEEYTVKGMENNHRYSMILIIFSFFESKLKFFAERTAKEFQITFSLPESQKQDYIHLYYKFFNDKLGVNLKEIEKYYTPIKQQKVIRNAIAHQSGIICENKVTRIQGLSVNELKEIEILKDEYVLFLIDKVEKFFLEFIKLVDKRYIDVKSNKEEKQKNYIVLFFQKYKRLFIQKDSIIKTMLVSIFFFIMNFTVFGQPIFTDFIKDYPEAEYIHKYLYGYTTHSEWGVKTLLIYKKGDTYSPIVTIDVIENKKINYKEFYNSGKKPIDGKENLEISGIIYNISKEELSSLIKKFDTLKEEGLVKKLPQTNEHLVYIDEKNQIKYFFSPSSTGGYTFYIQYRLF